MMDTQLWSEFKVKDIVKEIEVVNEVIRKTIKDYRRKYYTRKYKFF